VELAGVGHPLVEQDQARARNAPRWLRVCSTQSIERRVRR
jgi:hypothetical protein